MVNIEELIRIAQYLTLYTRCRIKRCCYNRVRLNLALFIRFLSKLCRVTGIIMNAEIRNKFVNTQRTPKRSALFPSCPHMQF
jgi:hypothetical protein